MSTHNHIIERVHPMPTTNTMTTLTDACKYAIVGLIVGCLVVAMGRAPVPGARAGAVPTTGTVAVAR